ncbi:MAG: hypothetical protein R3C04_02860 [Hyphomonas sp.]
MSGEAAEAVSAINAITGNLQTKALIEQLATIEAVNSGEAQAMGPRIREHYSSPQTKKAPWETGGLFVCAQPGRDPAPVPAG